MGIANEILDAVKTKLDAKTWSEAVTIEKQLVPDVTKTALNQPRIIVALQGIDSHEQDRTGQAMRYMVAVGLSYPASNDAQLVTALDLTEEIQDWLAIRANHKLTTPSGKASLLHPFVMEQVADGQLYREAGIYLSHTTFTYRFYKDRS